MDKTNFHAFFAVLVISSVCLDIARAAVVPSSSEDMLLRQLAVLGETSDKAEDNIAEKRYSQAQYTSARGANLDRAAVRRLLTMLIGKRSTFLSKQKRSPIDSSLPTAFENVDGFLVLAGRITNDVLADAFQDIQHPMDV